MSSKLSIPMPWTFLQGLHDTQETWYEGSTYVYITMLEQKPFTDVSQGWSIHMRISSVTRVISLSRKDISLTHSNVYISVHTVMCNIFICTGYNSLHGIAGVSMHLWNQGYESSTCITHGPQSRRTLIRCYFSTSTRFDNRSSSPWSWRRLVPTFPQHTPQEDNRFARHRLPEAHAHWQLFELLVPPSHPWQERACPPVWQSQENSYLTRQPVKKGETPRKVS